MADDANPAAGKPDDSTAEESGGEPDQASVEAETNVVDTAAEGEDYDAAASEEGAEAAPKRRMSHVRLATIVGVILVLALGGLVGWQGYQAYQTHQAEEQRNLFVQVGRQGALNLTTINWEQAEADVQRILDSATGTFYDDFQQRSAPFIEVVKQAQSKSVGEVTDAGLESESGDEGQVLVAVTVNTSNAGAPEQQPRSWRMRLTVQKIGDEAKVSNVEFVP
ncbi:tetratricopeptide repeat protein [Mycolicibacterium pulveris]|uniref:tetratricopeptide repeat protein n=1 Tax=Mycolicibacterium pulveris TaxID=36813 RepID=UPI003CF67E3B